MRITQPVPCVARLDQEDGARLLSQFAVLGEGRSLIVDSGLPETPRQVLAPFLEEHGRANTPLALVITHMDADHCGGTANLKRLVGPTTIIAHAKESPPLGDPGATLRHRYSQFAASDGLHLDVAAERRIRARLGDPFRVDMRVSANCEVSLGSTTCVVVHLPGHTAGHLGVWIPDESALIAGDAFMGAGIRTLEGRVLFPPQFVRPSLYLSTIRFAQELDPAVLLCAHEETMMQSSASAFLDSCLVMAEAIVEAVEESVSAGAKSLLNVCHEVKLINREWGNLPDSDFAISVAGCLCEMTEEGRVTVGLRNGVRTFERSAK
ncbi:MAG: MBL fold metallo-hydrolase [Actinomycetota bacterium]|jgi:glyoxylase-like metal-dependent hydrolase (beta-lactamase superfamily II)|nr:MBL fold metallo-hydrolase [Actinomycetota bacterium]